MQGVRINEVIYIILMSNGRAQGKSADIGPCEQSQILALWTVSLSRVQGATKQEFLPSDIWQWPVWRNPNFSSWGKNLSTYCRSKLICIFMRSLTENKAGTPGSALPVSQHESRGEKRQDGWEFPFTEINAHFVLLVAWIVTKLSSLSEKPTATTRDIHFLWAGTTCAGSWCASHHMC